MQSFHIQCLFIWISHYFSSFQGNISGEENMQSFPMMSAAASQSA